MVKEAEWILPNRQGEKCAVCRELKGVVQIEDCLKKEYWICLRCDRQIDWREPAKTEKAR